MNAHSARKYLRLLAFVLALAIIASCAPAPTPVPTKAPATAAPVGAPTAATTTPAPTAAPPAAPSAPIVMGLSGEPSTFDPAINSGTFQRTIDLLVYRGLYNYQKDGKPGPELAESYTVSPDNLTYTFRLRDANFHNGDLVTADDVKFTIERILDPNTGATFAKALSVIDSVTAVDAKTVQIALKNPMAPLLDYLSLPESVIVSKKWSDEHEGKVGDAPMGAGPYIFKEYLKGQRVTLEKFPEFYKPGIPKTDRIVFEFLKDGNTRVNALLSGDVDLIEYVPWQSVPAVKANPDLQVLGGTGPFMGLIFNVTSGPLSDARVRRAIGYAIDRSAIINTAFSGQGEPIFGMAVPKSSVAYDPKFDNYFKYDPAEAKSLLADAGYADGFTVRLLATSQYDFYQNTAVAIKAELAEVGIEVELDLPDWATQLQKRLDGDYDMFVVGTAGDVADPDYIADYYASGPLRLNSAAGYSDERVDELLEAGRQTIDPAKRKEIYGEIQQRVLDESPLLYLMWRDQSYAAKNTLQGFAPLTGFLSFQSGLVLEEATIEE